MDVVERDDPPGVSGTERRRRDHALHESGAASRSIRETIVKVLDRGCTRKGAHGAPQAVTSLSIEQRPF
jgi:hypothetical protein